MQLEWVDTGLLVLIALGLVETRFSLFGILRRENDIMATQQDLLDVLDGIGSDVDTISTDFTDFTNQIAALQAQLANAGQPTDISSDLMDKATALKTKLDALAQTVVSAPVGGSDTTDGGNGSDTTDGGNGSDTLSSGDGSDTTGGATASDSGTGDNGPPPGP